MSDWDPELYLRFKKERTRPSYDLIHHINHPHALNLTDLGCGPGNSTQILRDAYPFAKITGIDNSPSMLAEARVNLPDCEFEEDDISTCVLKNKQDIIFANASLQWLPNHPILLPHLANQLQDDGILAIQMPDNWNEPTHVLMRQAASEYGIVKAGREALLTTSEYYNLLVNNHCTVDIWKTTYYHVMPSIDSIIEWLRATGLRPYINQLNDIKKEKFLMRYQQLLTDAYPVQADGNILMLFPRLFIIARKSKCTIKS